MKILFCGDVVGKSGRRALADNLPSLKKDLSLDFVVVNVENAAHGFGLSARNYNFLKTLDIDAMTLGNHTFDKKEIIPLMEEEGNLLIRPLNYPEGTPGQGYKLFTLPDGRKILVLQVLGRLFMKSIDSPFEQIERLLNIYPLGKEVQAILVDVHAEATSEKLSYGYFLDGKVSLVAGTHTHVPTADARILLQGTGYITDVGMCANYDSVLGMTAQSSLARFTNAPPFPPLQPKEDGKGTLCGVYLETDDKTGKALVVRSIRIGELLEKSL